jgi:hypothetical protein
MLTMPNGEGRCRAAGDELVGKVEAGERVHRRQFEGVAHIEIRKQARDTLSEIGP